MGPRTLEVLPRALLVVCGGALGSADRCYGEMYSLQLESLEDWYGGWTHPDSYWTPYDFQQTFTAVHRAWLHVEATVTWDHYPSWIGYYAILSGIESEFFEEVLPPGETLNVDIAFTPEPWLSSGEGGVELWFFIVDPVDGSALVTDATLWFDATPVPEPASLALLGLGGLALRRRRR